VRLDGRFVRVHLEDIVDEYESNVEAALGLSLLFGGHHGEAAAAVAPVNAAPTASLNCERPTLLPGESETVTATATDADNDALTYEWSATAGQVTGNGPTATFTFGNVPPPASATITVNVSDGHGHTTPASCNVSENAPPKQAEAVSCLAGGFPRNLSRLNNVDKACLDDYAQRLKSDPRSHVVVIGYADSHERSADDLARQRAQAVSDYLVHEGGIDASRVTVRSGGATKPASTGTDAQSLAQNRRCEVWFVPEGAKEPD
jgi:outer membrane protein OmpA-like peptidoglycan-associated protein